MLCLCSPHSSKSYKTLQKTGAPSAPQWERACSSEPHAATINCTRDGFLFSTKISWEEMTIIQAHSADQGHFQRHKVECLPALCALGKHVAVMGCSRNTSFCFLSFRNIYLWVCVAVYAHPISWQGG
ncbi:unnamed protein product [Eretmochelys imbricata]